MRVLRRNGSKRGHLGRLEVDVRVVHVHDLEATAPAVVVQHDFFVDVGATESSREMPDGVLKRPMPYLRLHLCDGLRERGVVRQ